MNDHLTKLFNRYSAAMNRWQMAFDANNGNVGKIERNLSRKAYWAYHEWKTEEESLNVQL